MPATGQTREGLIVHAWIMVIALSWLSVAAAMGTDITIRKTSAGKASRNLYGVNLWRAFDPEVAESPAYQTNLAAMGVTVVRFHNAGMAKWIDVPNRAWDTNAVGRVMTALAHRFPVKMVTISGPPPWMDEDGDRRLDKSRVADYAAWCADLVGHVNNVCRAGVQWWEVLNEAELRGYDKRGDGEVLADIFRACSKAMRARDPSIRVGGNAWSWGMPAQAVEFLEEAGKGIAFYSYHWYATGDPGARVGDLYGKAVSADIAKVRKSLASRRLALPIWIDEWNMFYDWKSDAARHLMVSGRSAVYDALYLKSAAESGGADYLVAWNDADNTYGKMSTGYEFFSGAFVFMLYNRLFDGTILTTSSSDVAVVPFAVKGADGAVSVSLVNRSESPREASISSAVPLPRELTRYLIGADGIATNMIAGGAAIELPAESVTVITTKSARASGVSRP